MTWRSRIMLLAVTLDWLLGEPPNALHSVAWFGRLVQALECHAPRGDPRRELMAGACIAAGGIAISLAAAIALERALGPRWRGWPGILIGAAVFKVVFAWRDQARYQGHQDVPLSTRGRIESRCLTERLNGEVVGAIYSSDLIRAQATSEIIAARLGMSVNLSPSGAVLTRLNDTSHLRAKGRL